MDLALRGDSEEAERFFNSAVVFGEGDFLLGAGIEYKGLHLVELDLDLVHVEVSVNGSMVILEIVEIVTVECLGIPLSF